MKRLIALLLLLATVSAYAETRVFRFGNGNAVALADEPCHVPAIVAMVKPEYQQRFKAGASVINGKTLQLCWIDFEGEVFVVDEEGTSGVVPGASREKTL